MVELADTADSKQYYSGMHVCFETCLYSSTAAVSSARVM